MKGSRAHNLETLTKPTHTHTHTHTHTCPLVHSPPPNKSCLSRHNSIIACAHPSIMRVQEFWIVCQYQCVCKWCTVYMRACRFCVCVRARVFHVRTHPWTCVCYVCRKSGHLSGEMLLKAGVLFFIVCPFYSLLYLPRWLALFLPLSLSLSLSLSLITAAPPLPRSWQRLTSRAGAAPARYWSAPLVRINRDPRPHRVWPAPPRTDSPSPGVNTHPFTRTHTHTHKTTQAICTWTRYTRSYSDTHTYCVYIRTKNPRMHASTHMRNMYMPHKHVSSQCTIAPVKSCWNKYDKTR